MPEISAEEQAGIVSMMMQALGARVLRYLSVPITSGWREIELMLKLGVSREVLRRDYPNDFRQLIAVNERQAQKYREMLQQRHPGTFVMNPGVLHVSGWQQADYMHFWTEMIRGHAGEMTFPPESIYSSGGRIELALALRTQIPVYDLEEQRLTVEILQAEDAKARERLALHWSPGEIEAYMPFIDFGSLVPFGDADEAATALARIVIDHNEASRRRQS